MKEINLSMVRGDTTRIGVTLNNAETAPDEIIFSVKESKDRRTYVIQKSLGNGIEHDTSATGLRYIIEIEPADTSALRGGRYCYDIEVHINGDVITPAMGGLMMTEDVTR